jgi:tetratricopeptide (TPR) repeat protein
MRNRLLSCILSTGLLLSSVSISTLLSVQHLKANSHQEAVTSEENTIDAESIPTFTAAYLSGQIADSDNDVEQAIAFYKRALEFDPESLTAKRRLFSSLLLAGEFDDAIEIAQTLKDDADVAELVEQALAIQTVRNREYSSTDRYLEYSPRIIVDELINDLLSAWSRFGANEADEALAKIDALEGPAWFKYFKDLNSGLMAYAAGKQDLAIRHLTDLILDEQSVRVAPDAYLLGYTALASIYAIDGDKEKALDALDLNPNIRAAFSPADALAQLIEAGEDISFPVKTAQEGAAYAIYAIAGALNNGQSQEIVGLYLQLARALDPDNAEILVLLADVQEQLDKPEKAIETYRMIPEGSPMRRLSELQLGLNLADIGKIDEALEHIRAIIEKYPKDVRAYEGLGRILAREKRYREVVENFEQGIKAVGPVHSRSHWNMYYRMAIGFERLKEWEKAEPAFLRSLELSPNQPDVMNYLGYSWIDMNIKLEEGMDLIRAAVEARPNSGYIVDSLGWAYYRQGQYENAVRELERAVELLPNDPTINDHLGDAYWQVGRKIEARFQWKRSLLNMSDFDENLVPAIEKKIKEGMPEDTTESASTSSDG